jgi:uncharacterized membrane protein
METANQTVLVLHIAAGFGGLMAGLVPIFAQKGTKLHVQAGLVFYYAMMVVCATALWLVFFKPSSMFLLFIALFSFYMAYAGKRAFLIQNNKGPFLQDKLMAAGATLAGTIMAGIGAWSAVGQGIGFSSTLFLAFGFFFGQTGFQDFKQYVWQKQARVPGVVQHIVRMMGGYIAFVTAFATVNARYIPHESAWVDMAAWLLPGIVGGIGISRYMRMYQQKRPMAKV